jgi:hypothetical protein
MEKVINCSLEVFDETCLHVQLSKTECFGEKREPLIRIYYKPRKEAPLSNGTFPLHPVTFGVGLVWIILLPVGAHFELSSGSPLRLILEISELACLLENEKRMSKGTKRNHREGVERQSGGN